MKYLLDTNAVSALMKGDARFLARLEATRRDEVYLPQPVIAEIEYGIARLPASRRKRLLRERFDLARGELGRVEWTDPVSAQFGAVKAALERSGARIEDFDVAVAAHALALDAVLVTANGRHLRRVAGLTVEDWTTR